MGTVGFCLSLRLDPIGAHWRSKIDAFTLFFESLLFFSVDKITRYFWLVCNLAGMLLLEAL